MKETIGNFFSLIIYDYEKGKKYYLKDCLLDYEAQFGQSDYIKDGVLYGPNRRENKNKLEIEIVNDYLTILTKSCSIGRTEKNIFLNKIKE